MMLVNPSYLTILVYHPYGKILIVAAVVCLVAGALRDPADRGHQDMNGDLGLVAGFFAFVLTAVAAAGYFYQRLAERRNPEGSGQVLAGEQPTSRAAFANLFQSIGENFPAAKNEQNPYRMRLMAAGYRWPPALPIFYGIKCGSALFFAACLGSWRCSTGMILRLLRFP